MRSNILRSGWIVVVLVGVAAPGRTLGAPYLEVRGTCPGVMTIAIDEVQGSDFVLLSASRVGNAIVSQGSCAGAVLALDNAGLAVRWREIGVEDGHELVRNFPASTCGTWLQVFDLDTCEASRLGLLAANERVFAYTGVPDGFIVPAGVDTLHVAAWG